MQFGIISGGASSNVRFNNEPIYGDRTIGYGYTNGNVMVGSRAHSGDSYMNTLAYAGSSKSTISSQDSGQLHHAHYHARHELHHEQELAKELMPDLLSLDHEHEHSLRTPISTPIPHHLHHIVLHSPPCNSLHPLPPVCDQGSCSLDWCDLPDCPILDFEQDFCTLSGSCDLLAEDVCSIFGRNEEHIDSDESTPFNSNNYQKLPCETEICKLPDCPITKLDEQPCTISNRGNHTDSSSPSQNSYSSTIITYPPSSSSSGSISVVSLDCCIQPAMVIRALPVATTSASTSSVSCHQCKLRKPIGSVLQCTHLVEAISASAGTGAEGKKKAEKKCVKKYCSTCLKKHYDIEITPELITSWKCPVCRGECSCAACVRKKTEDAEEASLHSALYQPQHHHHHHAHLDIVSHAHVNGEHHHHHIHHHHHHHHDPSLFKGMAELNLRGSCHHCKSSKSLSSLIVCTARRHIAPDGRCTRDCKKKFCATCLEKWFHLDIAKLRETRSSWICPACNGLCCCAACRKKQYNELPSLSR